MEQNIAWRGELILSAATWSDNAGHKVKFKIVGGSDGPNPFKYFTKRRKGKAGTRFSVSLVHVQDKASVVVELMLANWQDSSATGHSVEFWCPPPDNGMHVFEGFERGKDSFMAALVELDDDDTVIDQKARETVENHQKPGKRPQRLSQVAAMMGNNPDFWSWAELQGEWRVRNEQEAAEFIRDRLGIDSRSLLDQHESIAQSFHDQVRKPFAAWLSERKGTPF